MNMNERTLRVGVIGCGWAFDLYLASWPRHPDLELAGAADLDADRLAVVCRHYGIRAYASNDDLLADASIDIVVNLTPVPAHHAVSKAALAAGKHVYSEKPVATTLDQARELFALAATRGLQLAAAPCNVLGATAQTMWKAVRDGAVGQVRLVYAELDSNPIYLMHPERWRSATGAPWPHRSEFEVGCTWEHAGYHLAWMCAMFGPIESATAFSRQVIPNKADDLDPPDTPDFSVACLCFRNGVTARLTCSIAAPYDHRLRVIGDKGVIAADTYRDDRCPVRLAHFTRLPLAGWLSHSVRNSTALQRLFGVRGRRIRPVADFGGGRQRRREHGWQDKCLGIADLAGAIRTGGVPFLAPDFIMHLTEVTSVIASAGAHGTTHVMETTFAPLALPEATRDDASDYREAGGAPLLERLIWGIADRLRRRPGGRG